MATILVNDVARPVPNACETWGELLAELDRSLSERGHVVTGARFDGVDEPAFRDPGVASRPLEGLATVEVEVGTPTDLIARSLDEAAGAIDGLADAALRVGAAFRGYDIDAANQGLSQLAEGLRMLVMIVSTVAQARQLDVNDIACPGGKVGQFITELTEHIEAVITAQAAADWITVADVVEYDIEPTVRRWRTLLEDLRQPTQ